MAKNNIFKAASEYGKEHPDMSFEECIDALKAPKVDKK